MNRILFVDDDPNILQLLIEVLRAGGFTNLLACPSAKEALKVISHVDVPFDCFLLDIQMNDMDGIELTSKIRALDAYRKTPILMMTAMSERSYIDRAFTAGASDYITKPFAIVDIHSRLRLIQSLINERRQMEDCNPTLQATSPSSIVTAADLERRFLLQDIDGFVDYLALENYLFQISHASLFGTIAFGVVVQEMTSVFRSSSLFEFEAALIDFAEAISDCLKPQSFLAAHAGGGHFVCVLSKCHDFDPEKFEQHLTETLKELDLHFCDGRGVSLRAVVGDSVSLHLKSPRGLANSLIQALHNAEAEAENPRSKRRAPPSPLTRLFGFVSA